MKLKNLINYLLENVDEGALRGFSLDILKKKMPEFEKYMYPEDIGQEIVNFLGRQYRLPYMGVGSSRVVYTLSTGKVLKVAINPAGVSQNEAEYKVSRHPSLKYIGARVYDTDPNFQWSVMEVAKIYSSTTQLMLDLGIPKDLAERWGYNGIRKIIYDLDKVYIRNIPVENVVAERYGHDGEGDPDPELDKTIEDYKIFLKDAPVGLLALVDLTNEELGENKLEYGDIVPDHFGRTADGRPVLIDYGFTTGVAAEHYVDGDSGSESEGSPPPSSIMSRDEEEDIEYEDELDRARIENMRNRPRSPSRVSKSRASGYSGT